MANSIRMIVSYLSYITWRVVNVQKKIQSSHIRQLFTELQENFMNLESFKYVTLSKSSWMSASAAVCVSIT